MIKEAQQGVLFPICSNPLHPHPQPLLLWGWTRFRFNTIEKQERRMETMSLCGDQMETKRCFVFYLEYVRVCFTIGSKWFNQYSRYEQMCLEHWNRSMICERELVEQLLLLRFWHSSLQSSLLLSRAVIPDSFIWLQASKLVDLRERATLRHRTNGFRSFADSFHPIWNFRIETL